ncbi:MULTISPECIES: hypothetical protein [Aerococcus]|uniref:Uncharacterized protein n=1 Tax=Aerococcus urinae TaxID=1376 RepID=A0A2I1L760_9LACT|nr:MULTISPECIES: hypothetical protein [Aerococcus]KAA9219184.1 hypothetical protein F6I39_04960 [Aerococcus loyolae]KAA9264203.1 hypothetical protein F6I19_07915 [Aerococcus loyolae]MCY3067798.1 hypothetical protein [Aerococcus mictus]MCY3080303.1 hypothetical protein [Aerococcus mictus]MCY3084082.1 hypothetical protein [Aerococcus mictus]
MTVIEMGGWASALVAIITLVSKIIQLITAIQRLITRLDVMAQELDQQKTQQQALKDRIQMVENTLMETAFRFQAVDKKLNHLVDWVKEMSEECV